MPDPTTASTLEPPNGRRSAVAVTGLGVVSPAGSTLGEFWGFLLDGRSAGAPLTIVDLSNMAVGFGCEVRGFDAPGILGAKTARRHDRFSQFALGAAKAAVDDAGSPPIDPARAAVIAGCAFGGIGSIDPQGAGGALALAPGRPVNPTLLPRVMPNAVAALVSLEFGWRGPTVSTSTACAAGAHAIGLGMRLVQEGAADVVLAGGAESPISPLVVNAFAALGALSRRSDAPGEASRPFDRARDGFVLGEGGAFCVLEAPERAQDRGARIYALLSGYAANSDAYHILQPHPDGEGARECMALALCDAGLGPGDVAHVNAHGTSTPQNDLAEARAVAALMGDRRVPVTSTKGAVGHSIGAAGAVEAVASCLSVFHETIPPVATTRDVDEGEIPVDVVIGSPRPLGPGAVLSNSFAFGGHNATLVFERASS